MRLITLLRLSLIGVSVKALEETSSSRLSSNLGEHLLETFETATISGNIEGTSSCVGCQGILSLLKGLAFFGDGFFTRTIIEICKISGAEDDDICEGAISREGPIIAQAIRGMSLNSNTADQFCVTFLGLCAYPDVNAWSVPFPTKKPKVTRPATSRKEPIQIVQFSDIHIDLLYQPGANADCGKPICCRPYTEADGPGNNTSPAGPNGDHNCDSPVSLEKSMYTAIKQVVPNAAFSIFTGDIVDHAVWSTTDPHNGEETHLGIVYATAGNHEANPTNAFPPQTVNDDAQWVYNLLASKWSNWTGASSTSDIESIGAFSTKFPGGNLRVISVNMNMYYRENYWLYQRKMIQDPNFQFNWLVNELDAAETAGENVYIIGHMPPGATDAFHDSSNYFDQIINRYSATIAAMFYGHTHYDHFEITYSDYTNRNADNALVTSYICPSLTPTSGMPAFRVYDVDPETFAILDATTYRADMNNSEFQTSGPVWAKYYSAKETYGSLLGPPIADQTAELSAAFWHNITETFEASDELFQDYIDRKSRGWKNETCTGDCKAKEICQLRAGRAQDNCYKPKLGIHFDRRALHRYEERDGCGISVSRATINAVVVKKQVMDHLQKRYDEETERRKELEGDAGSG